MSNHVNVLQPTKDADWGGYRCGLLESSEEQRRGYEAMREVIETKGRNSGAMQALREASGESSFPLINADTMSRFMRQRFEAVRADAMRIAFVRTVQNFQKVKTFRIDGLEGEMQQVEEFGAYKEEALVENKNEYQVNKYGKQVQPISWESWVNDFLGIYATIGNRYADAAINTDNAFITRLIADSSGPVDAAFSIATATSALAITALQTGVTAMMDQSFATQTGPQPLSVDPVFLMVPPALKFTAKAILNSTVLTYQFPSDSGQSVVPLATANTIADEQLQLIVNPWLPKIDTTSGDTAWYLFSDPAEIPFIEMGRLAGHETPEIHFKSSDMTQAGGGEESIFRGSFDNDVIRQRIRHVTGGIVSEDIAGYASTGAA